ncbi:alpha-L-arabinofuranosidase C-terminal domain-containing protein [Rathayibacter soli]|uniref:alpha-L-arabinofuranosidase C-terminal domain-containing protein n=1 Tax=Rathayibacter soli TaxID=3144168 RepID=UPI0027E3D2D3|nr:alpha-L-arabinofuranosidase C-terminal domain-containing protein [Glaciibacter superstes]
MQGRVAVNLGTQSTSDALELLEYANIPAGTARSELRRSNGKNDPFDVQLWCLGNEMDGRWQIGFKDAEEYGKLAAVTAKAMRALDSRIQLVACGSSGRGMPTFASWERTVLQHAYEEIDYLSCHAYYCEADGDVASYLASGVDMDDFIEGVVSTIEHVRAERKSNHRVNISFDEWNIWYPEHNALPADISDWPDAPRSLENVYSVTDAVAFGGLLISLLNHADRVTSASLAQLVNVIAPIMTEPAGPAWKQTTFHPFALASKHARGTALQAHVVTSMVSTSQFGEVPAVDAAATVSDDGVRVFIVNRSVDEAVTITIDVAALAAGNQLSAVGVWDDDRHARNTLQQPNRVEVRTNTSVKREGRTVTLELPPVSWTCVFLNRRSDLIPE